MDIHMLGRRVTLGWLLFFVVTSIWWYSKGLLLFSIVSFAPSIASCFYLSTREVHWFFRLVLFIVLFLVTAAIYNNVESWLLR